MSARDRKQHEYRHRLQAEAAPDDDQIDRDNAAEALDQRMGNQARWVELQVQQAIRRGEFDDLPGSGKPIPDIDAPHDPNWWLKQLIAREQISVLPPALALRNEHAEMDDILDRESTPDGVRRIIDDFNARIVEARRQLQGGPPVITPLRDADDEILAWSARRSERVTHQRAMAAQLRREHAASTPPSLWQRLLDRLLTFRQHIA
ncbi:MAG: DUF1992 domain-containing protein [Aeromicrobium sp.]